MAVTPVPNKAEYWANMAMAGGWLNSWFAANLISNPPYGGDPALTNQYYDGQLCAWYLKDHFGGTTYDNLIENERKAYVDYYVNDPGVMGGVAGYRNFTEGMLQDVLRSTAHSASSLAALQSIINNGSYVDHGDVTDQSLSRECAYAIMAYINAKRAGITLTSGQQSRLADLVTAALGHITSWVGGTAEFYRPFMGSITCHALIHYLTYYGDDARFLPAIESLATYTWTLWKSTTGSWGQANSFLYTNKVGVDGVDWWASTDDANTAPDLNMMIAPTFGWLFWKTGVQDWRDKGDLIFSGSISVYNDGFYDHGAYLGYDGNPSGKQIDQQLVWGPLYIQWAEMDPGTPPTPDPTPPTPTPTATFIIKAGTKGKFTVTKNGIKFTIS